MRHFTISAILYAALHISMWTSPALAGPVIQGHDDLGRPVSLAKVPGRIVVLTGSPLDVLFDLGVGDRVVGVVDSIERAYPDVVRRYPSVLTKERVGRFSAPNLEKIVTLDPDLIIAYASMEKPGLYTDIFEQKDLAYAGCSTVRNLEHGLAQIRWLGHLLGKDSEADAMCAQIICDIKSLTDHIKKVKTRPMVFYWWGKDNATYGRRAAVHQLIELAGGRNLAESFDRQYMNLSAEFIISQNPEVIIISYWNENQIEPRIREIMARPGFENLPAVKNKRVYAIDGHYFHTPLRFARAIRILAKYVHPEIEGVLNEQAH